MQNARGELDVALRETVKDELIQVLAEKPLELGVILSGEHGR
jgi:hypothetical protein